MRLVKPAGWSLANLARVMMALLICCVFFWDIGVTGSKCFVTLFVIVLGLVE